MDWIDDYENNTADPQDGERPIEYWWDDMRPREVRRLVKEVYERAFEAGRKSKQEEI